MKKYVSDLKVVSVEHINDKYVLIKLTQDERLPEVLPGQFVEVRVDGSPSTFLRRPISVNFVDYAANELWLLVAAVGDGTRRLACLQSGDVLNCMFPLGNGFTMPSSPGDKVLLVGGGVGVAPLLYFGKRLNDAGCRPVFRERGFVTNHSVLDEIRFDRIATCGPKPMMVAVAKYANKNGIECEVSLENMMACGLGACLCCVEKTVKGNVCVCKEGPVINIKQLLWQI